MLHQAHRGAAARLRLIPLANSARQTNDTALADKARQATDAHDPTVHEAARELVGALMATPDEATRDQALDARLAQGTDDDRARLLAHTIRAMPAKPDTATDDMARTQVWSALLRAMGRLPDTALRGELFVLAARRIGAVANASPALAEAVLKALIRLPDGQGAKATIKRMATELIAHDAVAWCEAIARVPDIKPDGAGARHLLTFSEELLKSPGRAFCDAALLEMSLRQARVADKAATIEAFADLFATVGSASTQAWHALASATTGLPSRHRTDKVQEAVWSALRSGQCTCVDAWLNLLAGCRVGTTAIDALRHSGLQEPRLWSALVGAVARSRDPSMLNQLVAQAGQAMAGLRNPPDEAWNALLRLALTHGELARWHTHVPLLSAAGRATGSWAMAMSALEHTRVKLPGQQQAFAHLEWRLAMCAAAIPAGMPDPPEEAMQTLQRMTGSAQTTFQSLRLAAALVRQPDEARITLEHALAAAAGPAAQALVEGIRDALVESAINTPESWRALVGAGLKTLPQLRIHDFLQPTLEAFRNQPGRPVVRVLVGLAAPWPLPRQKADILDCLGNAAGVDDPTIWEQMLDALADTPDSALPEVVDRVMTTYARQLRHCALPDWPSRLLAIIEHLPPELVMLRGLETVASVLADAFKSVQAPPDHRLRTWVDAVVPRILALAGRCAGVADSLNQLAIIAGHLLNTRVQDLGGDLAKLMRALQDAHGQSEAITCLSMMMSGLPPPEMACGVSVWSEIVDAISAAADPTQLEWPMLLHACANGLIEHSVRSPAVWRALARLAVGSDFQDGATTHQLCALGLLDCGLHGKPWLGESLGSSTRQLARLHAAVGSQAVARLLGAADHAQQGDAALDWHATLLERVLRDHTLSLADDPRVQDLRREAMQSAPGLRWELLLQPGRAAHLTSHAFNTDGELVQTASALIEAVRRHSLACRDDVRALPERSPQRKERAAALGAQLKVLLRLVCEEKTLSSIPRERVDALCTAAFGSNGDKPAPVNRALLESWFEHKAGLVRMKEHLRAAVEEAADANRASATAIAHTWKALAALLASPDFPERYKRCQFFTVQMEDRDRPEALCMGMQVACCLRPDHENYYGMLQRLADPAWAPVSVRDAQQQIVAVAWGLLCEEKADASDSDSSSDDDASDGPGSTPGQQVTTPPRPVHWVIDFCDLRPRLAQEEVLGGQTVQNPLGVRVMEQLHAFIPRLARAVGVSEVWLGQQRHGRMTRFPMYEGFNLRPGVQAKAWVKIGADPVLGHTTYTDNVGQGGQYVHYVRLPMPFD